MTRNDENLRLPGFRPLGQKLDRVVKKHLNNRGFASLRIIADWPRIVGEGLANKTMPVKLTTPAKTSNAKPVLTVEVYDSAFAMQLSYLEAVIIEKIATFYGYRAVHKMHIVHRPSQTKLTTLDKKEPTINDATMTDKQRSQLDALLDGIDNPELRKELQSLGTAVFVDN